LVRWVVGPTLDLFSEIRLDGAQVMLSTGTYSRFALESVLGSCTARHVTFMGRLDMNSTTEWANGMIDPKALLDCFDVLNGRGVSTRIFVAPFAHAKVYIGSRGVISGSANLTLRGFGGGFEIVTVQDASHRTEAIAALETYSQQLEEVSLQNLRQFVRANIREVSQLLSVRPREDRLPRLRIDRPNPRPGSYDDFVGWCKQLGIPAATEIAERAAGKHNLQGHVHRSFYGLRQFFITYPAERRRLQTSIPGTYHVFRDKGIEAKLRDFVAFRANDEPDFSLGIWKTYLPIELGGRATRRGGAIGSMNMMMPLVAKYLSQRAGRT
jgi:hypothetical protein